MGIGPRRGIRRKPQSYRATLITLMLVAFALSGFGAGLVTRTVAGDALSKAGNGLPTSTSQAHAQAPTSTASPAVPGSTATALPTVIAPSGFTLQAASSAKSVSAGQQFTVVVIALASDNVTPVSGLTCYMRARTDGAPPLFQQWPASQVTGRDGRATWTLTAPQNLPGSYGYEIVAYGQHAWYYRYDGTITITANG